MVLVRRLTEMATVALVMARGLGGCSNSDTPADSGAGSNNPACGRCEAPAPSLDLSTPEVSFQKDVFPVLRASCTASKCHGTPPGTDPTLTYPALDLYLGPPLDDTATPTDVTLYARIVADLKKTSRIAKGRSIVSPGAPDKSFLIDKLYACQSHRGLSCEVTFTGVSHCPDSACGDPMPPRDQPRQLSAEERDVIRRWIAQGARDN